MARYRGGDGHYADVECAYADLKRYLVLKRISPPARSAKQSTRPAPLILQPKSSTRSDDALFIPWVPFTEPATSNATFAAKA